MKILNKQDLDKLVEEPFEKFLSRLDLKCPDPVDAIPVEWVERYMESVGRIGYVEVMLDDWRAEQWKKENE